MSLQILDATNAAQFPLTIRCSQQEMVVELHPEGTQLALNLHNCPEPQVNQPLELVNCAYFATALYHLTEPMLMDYSELDSPVVYTCVAGSATVVFEEQEYPLSTGQQMLVPAQVQELAILPDSACKILESYR